MTVYIGVIVRGTPDDGKYSDNMVFIEVDEVYHAFEKQVYVFSDTSLLDKNFSPLEGNQCKVQMFAHVLLSCSIERIDGNTKIEFTSDTNFDKSWHGIKKDIENYIKKNKASFNVPLAITEDKVYLIYTPKYTKKSEMHFEDIEE